MMRQKLVSFYAIAWMDAYGRGTTGRKRPQFNPRTALNAFECGKHKRSFKLVNKSNIWEVV